jgi:5'-methylthioadenosine phosphorylase
MNASLACIGGIAAHQLLHAHRIVGAPLGPQPTPYGESQPIYRCPTPQGDYLFLSRYGDDARPVPPQRVNARANLFALKELGVRWVVAWNESKAISHNYRVGQFVLVDDIIDETVTPPASFLETLDAASVRQWPVFCPELRQRIAATLRSGALDFSDRGVYICVEGHRQETPAEVRKYAAFGGDLIGRALAPEAFLAKEIGLSYACVSFISSYAECGSSVRPYERGRVLDERIEQQRREAAVECLPRVMAPLAAALASAPPPRADTPPRRAAAGDGHVAVHVPPESGTADLSRVAGRLLHE